MTSSSSSNKTQKVVVTGVNGFVGKHLVNELVKNNLLVIGVGREDEPHPDIAAKLTGYFVADLTKEWPITETVDSVIHLAGLAAVGPSFESPQLYIEVNSSMVTHMAEHYIKTQQKPRLIIVSSGAVYSSDQDMPLKEDSAIDYASPYVVSKLLVENQCNYYRKRGLDCIVVRPFNHIGPGQLAGFLVPDVIKQLQEGATVTVGNIQTRRDYTDVRDIARAYHLLATAENLYHTTYNACSGVSRSGEEIVTTLKKVLNKEDAEVVIDQSLVRPTDAPEIYGDASALTADTGWAPEIPFEQTLADCVE